MNLSDGLAIPAHPLALDATRRLDERHQRALSRYYHAAEVGGVAVGVHTTQFAIRDPRYGLLAPVLELAAETLRNCDKLTGRSTLLVAGVCGRTPQGMREAQLAANLGYNAVLVSPGSLDYNDSQLVEHVREISTVLPVIGFYLQPAVGGRRLSASFWRSLAMIEGVVAIKIAPFNRYATYDVVRGVADSGRASDVVLYTGNDDNIVVDLLTRYSVPLADGGSQELRIIGGLLGHWACWTRNGVAVHRRCSEISSQSLPIPHDMLTTATAVTDANGAIFDVANNFAGCIAGIHEVLRRQGLMANNYCLDPQECLSPGQSEEIDRVERWYPWLHDYDFVKEHLDEWLA